MPRMLSLLALVGCATPQPRGAADTPAPPVTARSQPGRIGVPPGHYTLGFCDRDAAIWKREIDVSEGRATPVFLTHGARQLDRLVAARWTCCAPDPMSAPAYH